MSGQHIGELREACADLDEQRRGECVQHVPLLTGQLIGFGMDHLFSGYPHAARLTGARFNCQACQIAVLEAFCLFGLAARESDHVVIVGHLDHHIRTAAQRTRPAFGCAALAGVMDQQHARTSGGLYLAASA